MLSPPSFHATSGAIEQAESIDSDPTLSTASSIAGSHQMLQRVWTITSEKPLQTLTLNIPGVAFIDYDASLVVKDELVLLPPVPATSTGPDVIFEGDAHEAADSRVVAKIVVTSDSNETLNSLEVVALDADKEDQGFKFRVKNENAKLEGSILTQVFVGDKHTLQEFSGHTATFVLDDTVLVHNDPQVDVSINALDSGSVYLSAKQGFTLRNLVASMQGSGVVQLQAPFIKLAKALGLVTEAEACTLAVSADSISAKEVGSFVMMAGEIQVQTSKLEADQLFSGLVFSGAIRFVGDGHVRKQCVMMAGSGSVNTSGVTSDKADVYMGWSGRVRLHAVEELSVFSLLFGMVEYENTKPVVVTQEPHWLWWKKSDKASSKAVLPAGAKSTAFKLYEFRDPPLRLPVAVHHRVSVNKDAEPELIDMDVSSSFWQTWGLAIGAVAVGVIAVVVTRRKTAPRVPKRV